ncbi:unnamed protein product [Cylicocyclus nassatus]|uniref:Uncharacterized protein n=1 Tax=Cylicocyclus nassatus TaxID=53992 RepID=A0AA36GVE7_CYLNA|nr:unnamed protein product [Cylicocyclus nassatus]
MRASHLEIICLIAWLDKMEEESDNTESTTKTRSDESHLFGFSRFRGMMHRGDKEFEEFWNNVNSCFLTCSACTLISMMIAICAFGFWMLISATKTGAEQKR